MASERLVIEITENGARVVSRNIEGIGKAAAGGELAVNKLKTALATVGVGFALAEAIRTVADFEGAMSRLGVTVGITGGEFNQARDQILELTSGTEFAASEIATALATITKAGLDLEQAFAVLPDVMNLQEVGQLQLAEAADVAANAMQRFNLTADDSAQVVNVLSQAALRSRAGVAGFTDAFRAAGPAAAATGAQFAEVSAAVAALAEKGVQGGAAGNALKKVLTELESPSKKSAEALDAIVGSADKVKISQVGLTAAIQELGQANLTTGQALELFGDKAGPVVSILIENAERVKELSAQFKDGSFSAAQAAEALDDNLKGALENLKGSLQAVILEFSKLGASQAVRSAVEGLGAALDFVARNATVFAGVIGALALNQLPALLGALRGLTALLAANPFGLFVVGLGAAVGALVQFRDQIQVTRDGTVTLGDVATAAVDKVKAAFEGLPEVAAASLAAVVPALSGVLEQAGRSFEGLVGIAALAFDAVVGVAQGTFSAMVAAFSGLPRAIGDVFFSAVNLAIEALNALLRRVQLTLNQVITEANRIAGNVGADLNLEPIALAQFEALQNPFSQAATELGDATAEAFRKSFVESSGATDFVNGVFQQAREAAAARGTQAPAGGAGVPAATTVQNNLAAGGGAGVAQNQELAQAIKLVNDQLQIELELSSTTGSARQLRAQQIQIEQQLRDQGINLAAQENEQLRASIDAQLREIQVAQLKSEIFEQIAGAEELRIERQQALNQLLAEGSITTQEYALASEELRITTVSNTDAVGGFTAALLRANLNARQLGETIGNQVVGAVDKASSAIADFAVTGFQNVEGLKEAFSQLFQDLGKQILQLIIKILILKAIKAGLGGLGIDVGAGDVGGSAAGGNIPGNQPRLVGERGPEVFVPSTAGTVVPNDRLGSVLGPAQAPQAAPPQVNVSVVNVSDPKEIAQAMGSAEGERVILNVLNKNRESVKRMANS